MRVFAIYNALVRTRRACCWLRYEPSNEHFSLDIAEWADEDDVPFPFGGYLARGQRLVEGTPVRLWAFSLPPQPNSGSAIQTASASAAIRFPMGSAPFHVLYPLDGAEWEKVSLRAK